MDVPREAWKHRSIREPEIAGLRLLRDGGRNQGGAQRQGCGETVLGHTTPSCSVRVTIISCIHVRPRPACFVGQPIVAAAAFQEAFPFACSSAYLLSLRHYQG